MRSGIEFNPNTHNELYVGAGRNRKLIYEEVVQVRNLGVGYERKSVGICP